MSTATMIRVDAGKALARLAREELNATSPELFKIDQRPLTQLVKV